MTEPKEELAPLTLEIVSAEETLGPWLDDAIRLDPIAEARRIEIDQWREWLRCSVDSETYKLLVEVDGRVRERWADLAVVLVRLGFESGRRHPLVAEEVGR